MFRQDRLDHAGPHSHGLEGALICGLPGTQRGAHCSSWHIRFHLRMTAYRICRCMDLEMPLCRKVIVTLALSASGPRALHLRWQAWIDLAAAIVLFFPSLKRIAGARMRDGP